MDDQTIWGLLLITYIIPFWFWQVSEHNKIEVRKKLYSDPTEYELQERRFNLRSLFWSFGLVVSLGAWNAGWYPIATSVGLLICFIVFFGIRSAMRKWDLLLSQPFRLWVAGSVVWLLFVAAWYLVFGRTSNLLDDEFMLLGVLPPVFFAVSVAVFRWAMRRN